jgi:hypothetical protein
MSARKIAFLALIVLFAASVETAWNVRGNVSIGPEGCRAMGGRFYGPSWTFEASGERALTAASPRLEVKNAFGTVHVVSGASGTLRVKLRKVVFLPTEEAARAFADRIELRIGGSGGLATVETNRDELGRHDDVGFETHLEIEAPADSVVQVRNEHGRVEIAGVDAADVASSFDGVSLERIAGDATVDVRHGNLAVDRLGGRLQASVRHGDVSLANVAGASRVDLQHGDLEARSTGTLEVDLAYGELKAAGVSGDLVLRGQHAPVTASDVTGKSELATTFGDVRLERVGGDARVKVEHGRVAASDLGGSLSSESSFEGVELERVRGHATIGVQHGSVEAHGLLGGARVRASGDNVTLDGFAGAVDVDVERGSVKLAPGAPLEAGVVARASHGEISLEVPDGSSFRLDAVSRRGSVSAPFAGLAAQEPRRTRGERVAGQHGSGGPEVKLEADDDVRLDASPARAASDQAIASPRATAVATPEAPEKSHATPAASARPSPPAEKDATLAHER